MKKLFENNSWVISLAGSVIFACISLPAVLIFNQGSTTGGLQGLLYFIGMAVLSLFCIYFLFWLTNKGWPNLKLEPKLLVVFVSSILLFTPLYLFYWKIIVRQWIYGLSTRAETIGYYKQIFAGIVSIHIPVSLITITAIYNQHLRKAKTDLMQAEKMVAERSLQMLIQQVDPHFLFNNLNILSSLISIDPTEAVVFTNKLAEIYRQLLQTQHETVVPLEQELEFARTYFYLLSCRFQNSLELIIENQNGYSAGALFILPLSLQFLIENVVKHNILQPSRIMTIRIVVYNNSLRVTNPVYKKEVAVKTGLGLKNLKERYFLLTQKNLEYKENEGTFTVELPLLKKLNEN